MSTLQSLEWEGVISYSSRCTQKTKFGKVKLGYDTQWILAVRLFEAALTEAYVLKLTTECLSCFPSNIENHSNDGLLMINVFINDITTTIILERTEDMPMHRKKEQMAKIISGIAAGKTTASLLLLLREPELGDEHKSEHRLVGTREPFVSAANSTENDDFQKQETNISRSGRAHFSTEVSPITPGLHMYHGHIPEKRPKMWEKATPCRRIRYTASRLSQFEESDEEVVGLETTVRFLDQTTRNSAFFRATGHHKSFHSRLTSTSRGSENDQINFVEPFSTSFNGENDAASMYGNTTVHNSLGSLPENIGCLPPLTQNVTRAALRAACGPSPVGFVNLGMTCYMSSVLISLRHLPAFRNWFLGHSWQNDSLSKLLIRLFSQSEVKECRYESLERLLKEINVLFADKDRKYSRSYQNDAHEFAMLLIDLLLSEMRQSPYYDNNRSDDPFAWIMTNCYKCKGCQRETTMDGNHKDVELPLTLNGSGTNLQQLLKKYESPVDVNRNCEGCSERYSECRSSVRTYPDILFIVLLRFEHNTEGAHKITGDVKIEDQVLFFEQIYELSSVVFHVGQGVNQGHYMCFVRNVDKKDSNEAESNACAYWKFDDHYVTASNRAAMKQETKDKGYLLFYRKGS